MIVHPLLLLFLGIVIMFDNVLNVRLIWQNRKLRQENATLKHYSAAVRLTLAEPEMSHLRAMDAMQVTIARTARKPWED